MLLLLLPLRWSWTAAAAFYDACIPSSLLSPSQIVNNIRGRGGKGWLLYDETEGDDSATGLTAAASSGDPTAAATAAGDCTSTSCTTHGMAQWLCKLMPQLSLGVLMQLGCQSLDGFLALPGLFDALLMILQGDREGCPGNV